MALVGPMHCTMIFVDTDDTVKVAISYVLLFFVGLHMFQRHAIVISNCNVIGVNKYHSKVWYTIKNYTK
jgi:hypothetical protein